MSLFQEVVVGLNRKGNITKCVDTKAVIGWFTDREQEGSAI